MIRLPGPQVRLELRQVHLRGRLLESAEVLGVEIWVGLRDVLEAVCPGLPRRVFQKKEGVLRREGQLEAGRPDGQVWAQVVAEWPGVPRLSQGGEEDFRRKEREEFSFPQVLFPKPRMRRALASSAWEWHR